MSPCVEVIYLAKAINYSMTQPKVNPNALLEDIVLKEEYPWVSAFLHIL